VGYFQLQQAEKVSLKSYAQVVRDSLSPGVLTSEMNQREGFGSGRQGRGAGRTNARTNVWQHIDGRDQRGHDYGSYESDHSGLPQHDPVPRGSDRREEFDRIAAERSDERDDWRRSRGAILILRKIHMLVAPHLAIGIGLPGTVLEEIHLLTSKSKRTDSQKKIPNKRIRAHNPTLLTT